MAFVCVWGSYKLSCRLCNGRWKNFMASHITWDIMVTSIFNFRRSTTVGFSKFRRLWSAFGTQMKFDTRISVDWAFNLFKNVNVTRARIMSMIFDSVSKDMIRSDKTYLHSDTWILGDWDLCLFKNVNVTQSKNKIKISHDLDRVWLLRFDQTYLQSDTRSNFVWLSFLSIRERQRDIIKQKILWFWQCFKEPNEQLDSIKTYLQSTTRISGDGLSVYSRTSTWHNQPEEQLDPTKTYLQSNTRISCDWAFCLFENVNVT